MYVLPLDIGDVSRLVRQRSGGGTLRSLNALRAKRLGMLETRLADIAVLIRLIEPHAAALGLALVRVKMIGGTSDPTLQVMAERPDTRQLSLEDCGTLSRAISDALDESDPIEGAYRLEVSSPGIDRPLTRIRDYDDWAGHEARVTLLEPIEGRKQFNGVLVGSEGEMVRVAEHSLPFAAVRNAKLVLTDKLIKATRPLITDEVEDEIEFVEEAADDAETLEGQD